MLSFKAFSFEWCFVLSFNFFFACMFVLVPMIAMSRGMQFKICEGKELKTEQWISFE